MKSTTTILCLLALLPLSLSTPLPRSTTTDPSPFPNYSITDYTTGCSPGGCAYSFMVSYTPPSPCTAQICEPAFSTRCNGTDVQTGLALCEDALVSSTEIPGWSNVTLQVRHQWDQDVTTGNGGVDGRFWTVANHTVVNGVGVGGQSASFDVAVVQLSGLA